MKCKVTIEDNQTGVQKDVFTELTDGSSAVDAVINSGEVSDYDWRIFDVSIDAEDEEPFPDDPRFPDRPRHPDFARLAAAIAEQDAVADALGLDAAASVDLPSLAYLAQGRVGMMFGGFLGGVVDIDEGVITAALTLYLDAFQLGVGFTKRGGHRPTETGSTGEKGGSL